MKINFFRSILLAVAAMVFCSAGHAQEVNVQATVPFAFMVGDQTYPAGEYAIKTIAAGNDSMYVKPRANTNPILIRATAHSATQPADKTKLVFHERGGVYFLYQVWVAGSDVGREFPASHAEERMAMNTTKADSVIVAAKVTR
jgi:hypothetical protein